MIVRINEHELNGVVMCLGFGAVVAAGLVRGEGTDEIRASVGRRLAGATRSSRIALGADSEESPLQSKRSSTFYHQLSAMPVHAGWVINAHCNCYTGVLLKYFV